MTRECHRGAVRNQNTSVGKDCGESAQRVTASGWGNREVLMRTQTSPFFQNGVQPGPGCGQDKTGASESIKRKKSNSDDTHNFSAFGFPIRGIQEDTTVPAEGKTQATPTGQPTGKERLCFPVRSCRTRRTPRTLTAHTCTKCGRRCHSSASIPRRA